MSFLNRRLFRPLAFALLLVAGAVHLPAGVLPLGEVLRTLPLNATRLLADPARPRVYALLRDESAIAVIDTTNLSVAAKVSTAPKPIAMSLSRDGRTLYVACTDSPQRAIDLIDLESLLSRGTFTLSDVALSVAEGVDGRLFVAVGSTGGAVQQIDATTGALQAEIYRDLRRGLPFLAASPDGRTLYAGQNSVAQFDVSTPTAARLQFVGDVSQAASRLVLSHDGRYLCLPGGNGNLLYATPCTVLFSTSDLARRDSYFVGTSTSGPLAFSPTDDRVYQTDLIYAGSNVVDRGVLNVFSAATREQISQVKLPVFNRTRDETVVRDIITDPSGARLFLAIEEGRYTDPTPSLVVLSSGAAGIDPDAPLSVVTSPLQAQGRVYNEFSYQITATNQPTGYGAEGLPPGLQVDAATGLISGRPETWGTYPVTLRVANAGGTSLTELLIDIPYSLRATVKVTAKVPATATPYAPGVFRLERAGDTRADLDVLYVLKGTTADGESYTISRSYKIIKAGKTHANLRVYLPGTAGRPLTKKIKLTIVPLATGEYDIAVGKAQIKIPLP